ncbi:hypothetical protein [Arenimonas sp.]|uniref:hypothetical protein n=1 Tax=Arenimonas sp. TaxID=1872635 RepID=UPI0039E5440F
MLDLLELLTTLVDLVIRWRFAVSLLVAIGMAVLVHGRLSGDVFAETLTALIVLLGAVVGIAWEYRVSRTR